MSFLIDKALESKAVDLLPTIQKAMDTVLQHVPSHSATSDMLQAAPASTAFSSNSNNIAVSTSTTSLELPIHLLEFSSSTTPLLGTKKDGHKISKPKTLAPQANRDSTTVPQDKKNESARSLNKTESVIKMKNYPKENKKIDTKKVGDKEKHDDIAHNNETAVDVKRGNTETVIHKGLTKDTSEKSNTSNRKRKFSHEEIQQQSSPSTKRPARKRLVVLSSTSEEEEADDKVCTGKNDVDQSITETSSFKENEVNKQTTSTDVVVTRSNRRVKPNRRYASANVHSAIHKEQESEIANDKEEGSKLPPPEESVANRLRNRK